MKFFTKQLSLPFRGAEMVPAIRGMQAPGASLSFLTEANSSNTFSGKTAKPAVHPAEGMIRTVPQEGNAEVGSGAGGARSLRGNSPRWSWRIGAWFLLKKLQFELASSRRFQRYCEQNQCPNLAKMEVSYQRILAQRIDRLQSMQPPKPL